MNLDEFDAFEEDLDGKKKSVINASDYRVMEKLTDAQIDDVSAYLAAEMALPSSEATAHAEPTR